MSHPHLKKDDFFAHKLGKNLPNFLSLMISLISFDGEAYFLVQKELFYSLFFMS